MLKKLSCFSLFNMPSQFRVDSNKLKSNYYTLSKKYHPDKNKTEKNFHKITTAYNILKDDLQRAEYLVNIKDNKERIKHDMGFLSSIMELEERCYSTDKSDEENKIILNKILDDKINECKDDINLMNVSRWKYFKRIKDDFNGKQ
ncbi:DNAJ protein [Spraguea lophii 42_110]|uniref:DNAJ protein n=1 Tax=Spraguea lophii (strain 42_110) TaxID=1358809 RepID=S7XJ43_SPRLO|nr:DNAJ protein [Spraguea lophii 42_110]